MVIYHKQSLKSFNLSVITDLREGFSKISNLNIMFSSLRYLFIVMVSYFTTVLNDVNIIVVVSDLRQNSINTLVEARWHSSIN